MAIPVIGADAPDFALPTDDGGTASKAALAGRKFVLYFYPKDNTEGCTLEAIDFSARAAAFEAAGTSVIGVSPDSIRSHCRFRDKHALAIRLASDPDHAVCEAYGVWQEKQMFGRRYMGVVRSTFLVGADGRIAAVWSPVRVDGHAEAALAMARQLGP